MLLVDFGFITYPQGWGETWFEHILVYSHGARAVISVKGRSVLKERKIQRQNLNTFKPSKVRCTIKT